MQLDQEAREGMEKYMKLIQARIDRGYTDVYSRPHSLKRIRRCENNDSQEGSALNVSWLAPVFKRVFYDLLWSSMDVWQDLAAEGNIRAQKTVTWTAPWVIESYWNHTATRCWLHDFEAWKWDLRKKVWNYLEDNDLADFPRPVHHRIPNFKGSAKAGERLAELPEFINAKVVKVNPDTPQKSVRVAALKSGKILFMQENIEESGQVSLRSQTISKTLFLTNIRFGQIPKGKRLAALAAAGLPFTSCFLWYDITVEHSSVIVHVLLFTVYVKFATKSIASI